MNAPSSLDASLSLDAAYVELCYAKNWTPKTRRWYDERLGRFLRWAKQAGVTDLSDVTAPLVRRYLDDLRTTPNHRTGQPLDTYTTHGHARAVRTFLFWAASEDLLDEKIPKRIALPRREQKVLKVLTDEQLERLFESAKRTDTPLRDTAILSLLLDAGLRASELTGLRVDDVTFTPTDCWLLVHGKGLKQREVGLGRRARAALHRYLHRERHAGPEERRIFLGKQGPMTPSGLDQLLYRLRDAAGEQHFKGVSVGAHRWRHTHAVRALEAGTDIYTVSKAMGHAEVTTTEGYVRAVNQRKLRQLAISPLDTLGR